MKKIRITLMPFLIVMSLVQANSGDCSVESCRVKQKITEMGEERNVDFFDSLRVDGSYYIEISRDKQYLITIECGKEILSKIGTEVRNKKLYVFSKDQICTKKAIKIFISAPDIKSIEAFGSNEISIAGIDNKSIFVKLDGSGNLKISGNTKKLDAELFGSNDLNAKDLITESVRIAISGASNARVYASQILDVDVGGIGGIVCYGNPKTVLKNISGIGKIKIAE